MFSWWRHNFAYAFFFSAVFDCWNPDGYSDYNGAVSVTENERECLDWSETQYSHLISYSFPPGGGARNYCRNPKRNHHRPWCYIAEPDDNVTWENCDYPSCIGKFSAVLWEQLFFLYAPNNGLRQSAHARSLNAQEDSGVTMRMRKLSLILAGCACSKVSFLTFRLSLRKHAYSNRLKKLPLKTVFRQKFWQFWYISAENIDCGYSLEPPRLGGSNEYQQSVFCAKIRKMYTPQNSYTI